MKNREKIVAVGLLTQRDMDKLGGALSRVYPIDQAPIFDDLLRAIDKAEADAAAAAQL